jgi:signal transduction histidine kinase
VVIPIRRETQVIGLILLESQEAGSSEDENIGFLSRLGDHAAIAITNARLYTEVQAANQAKSDFVSLVSHELKTPMTSIRGFTDLLATGVVGPVNENQSNFLSTIRSNVDRMAVLVSDLADVSRIEAGRLRLEFSPIAVNEVVDEVVSSTRAQILEKKQTLIVNIPHDIPPMWGDRVRLVQILTNLVSNAYKYTQAEGLIQISAEVLDQPRTEGSPKVMHVWVTDNGFGISNENQEKIFQKFYRSDDQKVRDAPGTGLGLNITKQLVELQGGKIWFESQFRTGTTFHFTIPIAEVETELK